MILRLAAVVFYAALTVALLAFIFANRTSVELSLFPSDTILIMPLYVALGIVFALGLGLGLFYSATIAFKYKHRAHREARLIAQLERELAQKTTTTPRLGSS